MSTQEYEGDEIVFVNRFTVPGPAEEFESAFERSAEFLRRQPGLLGYTLARHVDRPDQYVNIARWRDAAALRAATTHPRFQEHAAALRALSTREHDLYRPRRTHTAGTSAD